MNSKQKKISVLFQAITKLGGGENKDFSKEEMALNELGIKLTDLGGMSVPLEYVLREGGILRELGVSEELFNENDKLTPEEREEYNRLTLGEKKEKDTARDIANKKETEEHAIKVLKRAKLKGFFGKCAEAAIAINDVLFDDEGILVAAVNKWLWENEGRMVGHVAVEWKGSYWDAEGKKEWERIESWGMLDDSDEDYDFGDNPEQNATDVEKIYPSKERLLEYFGGCDLSGLVRALEVSDKEVRESNLGK